MDISASHGDDLLDVPNGDPASYCRLCLSDIDVEALFPDGQAPRQEVIDRIQECTGIQITLDEDYPSSVCWMCSLSLEEFQCFRERCNRYDVLIRRKRKELSLGGPVAIPVAASHNYEVVMEDDDNSFDEYDEIDPDEHRPLLRISSVQEHFDSVDGESNESLLEPSPYQPEQQDLKPDQETLAAYAEHFRLTNPGSEQRDSATPDDTVRPYQCNLCSRSFKNRANLWEHNRLHTGKLPFSCNDCGTTFSRVKSLMAHKKKYHSKDSTEDPPLRLKCKYCPRVFPRKGDRTQHMKMGHPDLYNPNDKTESSTPTFFKERSTPAMVSMPDVTTVKKPISSSTPTPSPISDSAAARFCCNLCTKNFTSVQELEEHISLMHPKDGILKCSLCPKTFKSRQTLRMHILNHQGKLPYKCDDCGSRFDRKFYLMKHREKYHEGDNCQDIQCKLKCKFCPRMFLRKIDRKTHTRMVHLKEIKIKKEKVEPCADAPTKAEVVDEPQSATPAAANVSQSELSFGCLQCGEQFPSAAMLREHTDDQHLKKTQDIKPIIAVKEPPKMIKKIKSFKTTLSARRPYKCPYCPKTFTQNYVMKEHTFIHTGSLRYRCDECLAMFNRPHYLRAHKLKYHGQNSKFKAIKCRFCSRSFVRKQDIKIHERIAHGVTREGSIDREVFEGSLNGGEGEGESDSQQHLADRGSVSVGGEDNGGVDDGEDNYVEGDDDEDNGDDNGEEDVDAESMEDPEIRDVVVTLERIPEDVLQTLDNSIEDDETHNNVESASDRDTADTPRLNVGITLHRCPKCFKVFKTRKSLKHHMIYHQNQLPFSCDECGVQFARNRPLQIHKQRYHSEDAPYKGLRFSCDYCPRIFLRDRDKLFHQKTVHVMERTYATRDESTPELKKSKVKKRSDYVCVVCCERFETEKSCQRHITEFHPSEASPKTPSESPAPQMVVAPKLEPGMELAEHFKSIIPPTPPLQTPQVATGVRPYKLCRCTTCVSIFKNRDNWTAHVQTHPNVRPHHCEPCLIKRKSRSNRKVTSVGFKCQHCPKVFTKASSLRVHSRLHTSELRFPCDECGMMYDRYRLLQAHKDRYHSEDSMQHPPLETFRCLYCPRTFMRQRDCNFHQESVHAI